MKVFLFLIMLISTNVSQADTIDLLPSNFETEKVNTSFNYPNSVDGAIETSITYTIVSQATPEDIYAYYNSFLVREWQSCASTKSKSFSSWFNKKRKLSFILSTRMRDNGNIEVAVMQYSYPTVKQFTTEFMASECK